MTRRRLFRLTLLGLLAVGLFALIDRAVRWRRATLARRQAIEQFCSSCHLLPPPTALPRDRWPGEIQAMYDLAAAQRSWPVVTAPDQAEVTEHFTSRAPTTFAMPPPATDVGKIRFSQRPLFGLKGIARLGGVTNVRLAPLTKVDRLDLVVCDQHFDLVLTAPLDNASDTLNAIATVVKPCSAEVVDLDGDGLRDLLVASLGTLEPTDEKTGSAVWLRGKENGEFTPIPLASGLGRVADMRAGDLDGDGDLDLAVAVFGWRKVGGVLWFENQTTDYNRPEFDPYVLDGRPGAVNGLIGDLDGDGRLDIVTLLSQQYETAVWLQNLGNANFCKRTLHTAPHPAWGYSGIELVDLDADGDQDALLTNGDTFDDYLPKPYHQVAWLENQGSSFTYHPLADFPAAYCAKAADLDGDGDLDVIACAFWAVPQEKDLREQASVDSVIWLEQTSKGRFVRHEWEKGTSVHPTLDVGDFDGDGDTDVVIGNWPAGAYGLDQTLGWSWATLYENLAK